MSIKARRLRKVVTLAELREDDKCDPLEAARRDGYDQAFKDFTERLRGMMKDIPAEIQKVVNEHFWDILE